MIQVGQKIGKHTILKPSGAGYWEVSDGLIVVKLSEEALLNKDFKKGELMYNIAPLETPIKKAVKKTVVKKKKK